MTRSEIVRYLVLRSIGNFLVLFAIFGVVATFGPSLYYEVGYRVAQARGIRYVILSDNEGSRNRDSSPTAQNDNRGTPLGEILKKQREQLGQQEPTALAAVLSGPTEQILVPKDTDFNILIPKLGANAKIYPNVDPEKETEFLPVLQKGVAHAKGSVFPGIKGNTYLFAHSTDNFWDVGRYNAIFYLLKDLTVNDDVVVFFEGKRHNYKVADSKIVDPEDVTHLIRSQIENEEKLVLQTCWPPGTTWKRLVVTATPR